MAHDTFFAVGTDWIPPLLIILLTLTIMHSSKVDENNTDITLIIGVFPGELTQGQELLRSGIRDSRQRSRTNREI